MMRGGVAAFELDRYSEFSLLEQRGRVLFTKIPKGEDRATK